MAMLTRPTAVLEANICEEMSRLAKSRVKKTIGDGPLGAVFAARQTVQLIPRDIGETAPLLEAPCKAVAKIGSQKWQKRSCVLPPCREAC
jgi:hypothetical protein